MEADQLSVTTEQNEGEVVVCATNRHPWLGVFLNCCAFSGAGYLYCRRYGRAVCAMLGTMTVYVILYGLIFVQSLPFFVLVPLGVLSFWCLKTLISVDVFRIIKRQNTAEFEGLRKSQKDAWLAVFLAFFYVPLAMIYLRRWCLLVVAVITTSGLYFFNESANENAPFLYGELVGLSCILAKVIVNSIFFWLACKGIRRSIYRMSNYLRHGMIVLTAGIVWFGIRLTFSSMIMQVYTMLHPSMEPSVKPGDRVIVSKLAYINSRPRPGDVIVFRRDDLKLPYIKRVFATAGQVVDMTEDGVLLVDGHEVSYDGLIYKTGYSETLADSQTRKYVDGFVIPDGHCYVVGDDLSSSFDSRAFGPIADEQIVGRMVRIFDTGGD